MTSHAERYLRHGRKYGTGDDFWQTAAADLSGRDLRRLAAELGVKLPSKWSTARNGVSEPSFQAGLTVDKSASGPVGPTGISGPQGRCERCDIVLGTMNTSGLCRRCYQRESKRARRSGA